MPGVTSSQVRLFRFLRALRAARRAAASPADYPLLSGEDLEIIESSLESGALLTDEQFSIAERLLLSFAEAHGVTPSDWLVLNGIPRHVGQAITVDQVARIACVVFLDCEDDTVLTRIAADVGGDRRQRVDDGDRAVRNKLAIYRRQTRPL